MPVIITNPINNSTFGLRKSITFKGRAESEVIRVELFADPRLSATRMEQFEQN